MRPLVAVVTAVILAVGGAACDRDEVGETLDQVGDRVSEAATEAADAVGDAASEVGEAASEAADLVGFCSAAVRTRDAIDANNAGEALAAAEDLAAEAPDEVRSEAETVREAVAAWHDGDEEAITGEPFISAAEAVRAHADERCDPRS